MQKVVVRDVRVQVQCQYVPERSSPKNSDFVFAYSVTICNGEAQTIQVLGRHWLITDAFGNCEEVSGEGVVGEQPIIKPGEKFQYTSFCPIRTSFGTMRGHYQAVTSTGEKFLVDIPEFVLAHPHSVH